MSSSRLKRCATTSARRPTKRGVSGSLKQLTIKIDLGSRQVTLNDRSREEDEDGDKEEQLDEEERNSWGTPDKIVRWVATYEPDTFRFVGDACASDDNHLFPLYFTEEMDAMKQSWVSSPIRDLPTCCSVRKYRDSLLSLPSAYDERGYIAAWFWNGPYNKTKAGYTLTDWFKKCYYEACKGICVVMLVKAPSGVAGRFDEFVYGKAAVVYDIPHRLRFKCPRTGIESKHSTARFGSQLVVFDPRMLCKDGCSELAEGDTFDTVIRPLSFEA